MQNELQTKKEERRRFKWTPSIKQELAFNILEDNKTTELFYGGGAGGGKSHLGCVWLITNCFRYPRSRWLMGRAILKDLKQSTLLTFFQICKEWGIVKDKDYRYNSINNVIIFLNGSEIYLKDLFAYPSDPEFDSLGSTEYTGAFVDEGSQVTVKAKNILMSRLRYKLEEFKIIPKLLIASNPSKNFLYYDYYKPWKEKKLPNYRRFIPALVTDNPFISPHYIENLKKLDKVSKERLLYGNFEYDDDPTRLFDYDSILDIFTNEAKRGKKYCIVDVAGRGRDKTVIGIWNGLMLIEIIIMENISSQELDKIIKDRIIPRRRCLVDEDGVGFGLVKDLPGIKGFVNNSKPLQRKRESDTEKVTRNYKNLKAQCWFQLAELVNNGGIGVFKEIDAKLKELMIEDLEQIKQKDPGKDTTLQIISKDDIRENIGRSTDIGDMLQMRMWYVIENNEIVFGFLK